MLTSHHSFSTRIFLKETPGAHAAANSPASAEARKQENLREFWWFLRGPKQGGSSALKPSSRGTGGSASGANTASHA